ncbi:MAG TPA: enoyl-CoA hydratase-related protein, partial [Steroidobacteraceae bacterium]|nr:enoyl-CoA hydratase-related protein [Steroidobacteraceae bacterium]
MTDSSTQRITLTIEDGVAEVRLNRPDKMNALDHAMFDALIAAGEQLAQTADLRAVVLSGEGRAFCAGLDMERMSGLLAAGSEGGGGIGAGRLAART